MRDRPYLANSYEVTRGFKIADIDIPTLQKASGLVGSATGTANISVSRISVEKALARPRYLDQVLPFDVVINAANEYGSYAQMIIHGVEILNVGSGMSIDDITTDEACTFVATSITPWHNQGFINVLPSGAGVSFEN